MMIMSGTLSKLNIPFDLKMNPYFDRIEKDNIEWIKSFNPPDKFLKKAKTINSSIMGCRAYHTADLERIQLASQWILWVLLADDVIDENEEHLTPMQVKESLAKYIKIVDKMELPKQPNFLEHMIFDIGARLDTLAPRTFVRRFLTFYGAFS